MSFRVAVAVEEHVFPSWEKISPAVAKLIFLKLALSGNDDGESVRPSVWTIASDTQTHERTVQRVLKAALDNGLLKVTKDEDPRQKLPKVYKIDLVELERLPLTGGAQERRRRKQERAKKTGKTNGERAAQCHPSTSNRCHSVEERVTQCRGTGDKVPPDPLEEPSEEPSARDARDPGPEVAGAERSSQADATAGAAGEGGKQTPANAHWKAKRQELEEEFGSAWGAWLKELVVVADDGELLILGAPSKLWVNHVASNFTDQLQSVLQRRVQVERFDKVAIALAERRRKRAAAAAAGRPP